MKLTEYEVTNTNENFKSFKSAIEYAITQLHAMDYKWHFVCLKVRKRTYTFQMKLCVDATGTWIIRIYWNVDNQYLKEDMQYKFVKWVMRGPWEDTIDGRGEKHAYELY